MSDLGVARPLTLRTDTELLDDPDIFIKACGLEIGGPLLTVHGPVSSLLRSHIEREKIK